MLPFLRAHGLGNDYIVLDVLTPRTPPRPDALRLLCDPHEGLAGDGVLIRVPATSPTFGLRIFNPDGSEAEKSGNGVRIFVRALLEAGLIDTQAQLQTPGGPVFARVLPPDPIDTAPGACIIEADMGPPELNAARVPFLWDTPEAVDVPLQVGETQVVGTAVSMGNPHFVMFTEHLNDQEVRRLGPGIEHHPRFPNRTNVQWARVQSRNRVEIRIWERGAGITRASGSSSCAVVAAGIRTGRLDASVIVEMPGGHLSVRMDAHGKLLQAGPVELICQGTLGKDLLRRLQHLDPDFFGAPVR